MENTIQVHKAPFKIDSCCGFLCWKSKCIFNGVITLVDNFFPNWCFGEILIALKKQFRK
jgi:hypothetical protein